MITLPQARIEGPWQACFTKFDGEVVGFHITTDPQGSLRPVVEAPEGWESEEYVAHARAVAAVPQMMRALRLVVDIASAGGTPEAIRAVAGAALAAAEGR